MSLYNTQTMRIIAFILIFLAVSALSAQVITQHTKNREAAYNREYANYWQHDEFCDTLYMEDGTATFLLRTPIRYLKGFTGLFNHVVLGKEAEGEVLMTEFPFLLGDRGYHIVWRIKEQKLYVDHVVWKQLEMCLVEDGIEKVIKGRSTTPEEIKIRLETLTGKKFNEDGLMLADWVTDAIRIVKYHPHFLNHRTDSHSAQFLERNQQTVELGFNKGELRSVCQIIPQKTDSLNSLFHERYHPIGCTPEPTAAINALINQTNHPSYRERTDEYRKGAASYLYSQWEALKLATTSRHTMADAYRICKVSGYYIIP